MDYSTLKVPELKQLLKERNLPQTGNKGDLILRLQEYNIKTLNNGAGDLIHTTPVQMPAQIQSPLRTVPAELQQEPEVVVAQPETVTQETISSLKRPAENEITEEERKRLRAEKYGVVIEADKVAKRGERFGTGEAADKASIEKIKNRAERFGVVSPIVLTEEEKARIEKRKERFGNSLEDNSEKPLSTDPEIAKRQSRFGVVEQEKPKSTNNNNNNRNRQFNNNNRQFNNNRRRF